MRAGKMKYGMTLSEARRAREEEEKKRYKGIGTTKPGKQGRLAGGKTPDQVQKASRDTSKSTRTGGKQGLGLKSTAAKRDAAAQKKRDAAKKKDAATVAKGRPTGGGHRGRMDSKEYVAAKGRVAAKPAKTGLSKKPAAKPAAKPAKKPSFKQKFAAERKKQGAGGVFTWNNDKFTTNYEAEQAAIDSAKARRDKKALEESARRSPGLSEYNKKIKRTVGPAARTRARHRRMRGGR